MRNKTREFSFVRRVVVKVGTSILRKDSGLNTALLRVLAAQIAALRSLKREVILVSSGAVGSGMMTLGLARRPSDTAALQAVAAVGQPRLMQAWAAAFSAHGLTVSQLLLTNDGLRDRRRFLNAKNAILKILDLGVVPIVNENDTVAVEELTFGDNDKLSALVAAMVDADLLINLTDVDGFYVTEKTGTKKLLPIVSDFRPEWLGGAEEKKREHTLGGMSAKLRAAQIAVQAGVPVVIANGRTKDVLIRILEGENLGTRFLPGSGGLKGKKVWLSFFPVPEGRIVVDSGACAAITRNGKSLLPSGILRAAGHFARESCVSIVSEDGREIARGITHYSSEEIALIAGGPSAAIRDRLGMAEDAPPEVVHRDNLVEIR